SSSRPRRPRFWPDARRRVSFHAPVHPRVRRARGAEAGPGRGRRPAHRTSSLRRRTSISRVFRCPTGKATRMDARARPAPNARTRRASPRTATIARAGRTDSRYVARNDAFRTRRRRIRHLKAAKSHRVALREISNHVLTWGDPAAPKLFLLHGWMDVGASFQFLVDALQRDWHAIAADLP